MNHSSQATTQLSSTRAWQEMLAQVLPTQGEWTEEEYLVLTEHRNRLVELSVGFLEILPMPTDKHQSVLQLLFLASFGVVKPQDRKVHFAPLRLRVRPGKFREPDMLVLLSADDSLSVRRPSLGFDSANIPARL